MSYPHPKCASAKNSYAVPVAASTAINLIILFILISSHSSQDMPPIHEKALSVPTLAPNMEVAKGVPAPIVKEAPIPAPATVIAKVEVQEKEASSIVPSAPRIEPRVIASDAPKVVEAPAAIPILNPVTSTINPDLAPHIQHHDGPPPANEYDRYVRDVADEVFYQINQLGDGWDMNPDHAVTVNFTINSYGLITKMRIYQGEGGSQLVANMQTVMRRCHFGQFSDKLKNEVGDSISSSTNVVGGVAATPELAQLNVSGVAVNGQTDNVTAVSGQPSSP